MRYLAILLTLAASCTFADERRDLGEQACVAVAGFAKQVAEVRDQGTPKVKTLMVVEGIPQAQERLLLTQVINEVYQSSLPAEVAQTAYYVGCMQRLDKTLKARTSTQL